MLLAAAMESTRMSPSKDEIREMFAPGRSFTMTDIDVAASAFTARTRARIKEA